MLTKKKPNFKLKTHTEKEYKPRQQSSLNTSFQNKISKNKAHFCALLFDLCDCTKKDKENFETFLNIKLREVINCISNSEEIPEKHSFFKSSNCYFIKWNDKCFLVFKIAKMNKNIQILECISEEKLLIV